MEREYETADPHPDFVKGFNEGYALAKYAPEIGGVFGAYTRESERGKGFAKGKGQYAYELGQERDQSLSKDASDNKAEVNFDARSSEKTSYQPFDVNRTNIEFSSLERVPKWLDEISQNKSDLDLDREPDQEKDGYEPDR